jgi:hypothetical protein
VRAVAQFGQPFAHHGLGAELGDHQRGGIGFGGAGETSSPVSRDSSVVPSLR